MEQVFGKIKKGGLVLIDHIPILISPRTNHVSRLSGWYGSFVSPTFTNITPGGPFQLFLDDGRSGNIIITNIKITGSVKQVFYFMGSGLLS